MKETTHFTVDGYEYRTWDDVEDDNIKTMHECYKNGVIVVASDEFYNHSPYSIMTMEEFVGYVKDFGVE